MGDDANRQRLVSNERVLLACVPCVRCPQIIGPSFFGERKGKRAPRRCVLHERSGRAISFEPKRTHCLSLSP